MSPDLLFLVYGVIVVAAMYSFVYIPNKKKHKKVQELRDSVKAGDMVVTIGGVVGKVAKKEEEYLALIIDEEEDVIVKIVLYTANQKTGK